VRGKPKKYADSLRVGIAVDGSAYGPAAVKYVLRHPELFGAAPNISLIHVVPTYNLVGVWSVAGFAQPDIDHGRADPAQKRPPRQRQLGDEHEGSLSHS
jgi:hypothetical protein